jgi:hypothetical protein
MKSFDKTQKTRNSLHLSKEKRKTSTDEILKIKKGIPGVGKYLDGKKGNQIIIKTLDVYKYISKGVSMRKGRFG